MRRSAVLAMALCVVQVASSQDTLSTEGRLVARYVDARSVATDPSNRIYVADAGQHFVDIRAADYTRLYILGGPGTAEGEFDQPSGVDATNGLVIVVADAGNARLQRFTRKYQVIESIPLYASGPEPVGSAPRTAGAAARVGDVSAPGRPIAVSVSTSNETFAVDESRAAVGKWNVSRRFSGWLGAQGDFGRLKEPVDLVIIADQLFVADRGVASVEIFDLFGGYVTSIAGGRLPDLAGLGRLASTLLAVHGQTLTLFDSSGRRLGSVHVSGMDSLQDVAATDTALLFLSTRELRAWPVSEVSDLLLARESKSERPRR